MEKRWFKPAEGMEIIDPQTRTVVPPAGKWVASTDEYFSRRELDGGGSFTSPPQGAE